MNTFNKGQGRPISGLTARKIYNSNTGKRSVNERVFYKRGGFVW